MEIERFHISTQTHQKPTRLVHRQIYAYHSMDPARIPILGISLEIFNEPRLTGWSMTRC